MDLGLRRPVLDFFKRGDVARDARLVEPEGGAAPAEAAVLGSPKLTDSEVENFARLANVSDEEILRTIGMNRGSISREKK
jgi:hypothetical protein